MPVVKTPSSPKGSKSFPPYDLNHYGGKAVRIHATAFDAVYDPSYDAYDDSHYSLSQWMNDAPQYSDSDVFEAVSCPPTFATPSPSCDSEGALYEDAIDGYFSLGYEATSGYDSSFYSLHEPSSDSYSAFSPGASVVSSSPRSESSALSLSPQPTFHDCSPGFNYDYPSLTHSNPSPSSQWYHESLSATSCSKSHFSGLEIRQIKPPVAKPTASSQNAELDPQQQRRRFPCVIIGCERRFTSQYTLKVHMEAHKPKPRSSFPCTLGCAERFSRQHDRLRHEVAKHGKICEFLCDECGRFFSTRKTLGNHKCPVAQGTRWVNN